MRCFLGFVVLSLGFGLGTSASGQTCTGLCLKQVSCPNGGTTSISGTIYTPNGKDPLPNALVYIPNATVPPFTAGVSCSVPGAVPPGSPLVGTTTAVDGTFTITNVPVGTAIPLVVQSGRWRRQVVVPATTACTSTAFSTRMPQNQSEGDIPLIAIATGNADQVECVLRKVGIADSEFTDPGGGGRINLYLGQDSPGATIDAATPSEQTLMGSPTTASQYDVIMLPCQGLPAQKTADELAEYVAFANAGGRIYTSHYSYDYMYLNPNLPPVADWQPLQPPPGDGIATVNTSFAEGETLSQWLQLVGATTTPGQMAISTLRHDLNGVIAPTQSWLTLNDPLNNNPVMQFVYDAPVGAANQCGRVLFNEYHVENPPSSPAGITFPNECSTGAMTAQEKLLEYSLFELTNDGGDPTLSPTSADFGSEPLGFQSASKSFTWTNNSTFPASASTAITPEFEVLSNNCQQVQGGSNCTISVAFTPTALGPQTGTLTVNSSGPSITASLTGIGVPDLNFSGGPLQFGSRDVGSSTPLTVTVTNGASGTVPVPAIATTGDYSAVTSCASTLAAGASCNITVTFKPTVTGDRPGTLTVGMNVPTVLDGNGVDFGLSLLPASGQVEAGLGLTTTLTTAGIAGYASGVQLSCTTDAPAVTCSIGPYVVPVSPIQTAVGISTVSRYPVIGYGGYSGRGLLWLVGAATGLLLCLSRRRFLVLARVPLLLLLLTVGGFGLSGCGSKRPTQNSSYTPAGSYTVTVSGTDGFLVHTATYALKVTAP